MHIYTSQITSCVDLSSLYRMSEILTDQHKKLFTQCVA